jgi:hypothetical protein
MVRQKKPEKSEFSKWFELQFGKRPTNKSYQRLRREVTELEQALVRVRNEMYLFEKYEHNRTAAHYAWVAREECVSDETKQ